jgi:hypothetical protein
MIIPILFVLASKVVQAHCPLCTVGAAAAAGGAAYLGVDSAVIGLFIGAFAIATGWWVSKLVKPVIPFQRSILLIASFALTVLPLLVILGDVQPVMISWAGEYGSLFNRTYMIDSFLTGSLFGGIIVCLAPWLSKRITMLRGKTLPFQGLSLTFVLLFASAGLLQVLL